MSIRIVIVVGVAGFVVGQVVIAALKGCGVDPSSPTWWASLSVAGFVTGLTVFNVLKSMQKL
jgi:hypothetical protein